MDYSELKQKALATMPLMDSNTFSIHQYYDAASPNVVLGLLAEVERLQSNIDERTGGVVRLMTERDTLRTQNQSQLELNAALLMDCGVLTNKNQALLEALNQIEVGAACAYSKRIASAAIKLAEGQDV